MALPMVQLFQSMKIDRYRAPQHFLNEIPNLLSEIFPHFFYHFRECHVNLNLKQFFDIFLRNFGLNFPAFLTCVGEFLFEFLALFDQK